TGAADHLFHNLPRGYIDVHYTTFQPRIGLSYAINSKTVLRSGFGRYMSRQGVSDGVFEGGAPPLQSYAGISGGSVDNPAGGAQGSFPTVSGRVDRSSPQPESYVWNFSVERELPYNTVLGVAYVGRRGLHGQFQANLNQAPIGSVTAAKVAGLNVNSYRPYAGYGPITIVSQGSGSSYNGLQVDLNHRFQRGMGFGLAYTFAHADDCGSFQKNFLPNYYDPKYLCGPADYDIRHALTINAITEIPFHSNSHLANEFLGGWQISQIYNFQTGTPLSVTTGSDIAGIGTGGGAQFYAIADGASLGAQGKFSTGSDQNFWFNPKAFVAPAPNTFTSQHNRNILRAPGVMNFNAGLQKRFSTLENQYFTFRFEAFDFPNHPNLSAPDTNPADYNPNDITKQNFGRVTSKTGQRSMQASLRYTF
ncbi:MAG TPA: hypothetical protein VGG95_09395, partial [Edaphobacter sp.]